MRKATLQELVHKIFSSEETRTRFLSNPDNVIAEFDLSETEKKAVLATHTRLGLAGNSNQMSDLATPLTYWF
jgi:hypothetical protein